MTTFLERTDESEAATRRISMPASAHTDWSEQATDRFGELSVEHAGHAADAATEYALEATIAVGPANTDLVATADGRTLVATHVGTDSVSLIDARSATVTATVAGLERPSLAATAGRLAFVLTSTWGYDLVAAVDTDTATIAGTFPVEPTVTALAVSPNGRQVYVGRNGRGGEENPDGGEFEGDGVDICAIDTSTGERTVIDLPIGAGIGASVDALRVSPDGRNLFVGTSDPSGGRLITVDAKKSTVVRAVQFDAPVRDLALSPDGRTVYVLTADQATGGTVHSVVGRANKVSVSIEIGGYPARFGLSPDGARLYVLEDDRVTVVCTVSNRVVEAIAVDAQPSGVAVSRDGAHVYVADYTGSVTVLSLAGAMREDMFPAADLRSPLARAFAPAGR